MTTQTLMKDGLNPHAINRISRALKGVHPQFDEEAFQQDCLNGLNKLELKQRIYHIIDAMHQFLPEDFNQTADLLLNIKMHWDYGDANDPLRGFAAWAVTDYVAAHGLQHPEKSLQLLEYLTSLFSSEFAVRFFILNHYELSYQKLLKWAEHDDEHIRRLASEGCRPRLPWGMRLQQFCDEPKPLIAILEKLKSDNSEYVRRSVANNLNDISKDNPQVVLKLCKQWSKGASKETQWIIKHATRTLVKDGHPEVFALLGYSNKPKIKIDQLQVDKPKIKLGESIQFNFVLQSTAKTKQKIVIDYAIHHVKASGNTSAKVFKLKTLELTAGESITLIKVQSFKKITTRKYYSGKHKIELLVNGVSRGSVDFELLV